VRGDWVEFILQEDRLLPWMSSRRRKEHPRSSSFPVSIKQGWKAGGSSGKGHQPGWVMLETEEAFSNGRAPESDVALFRAGKGAHPPGGCCRCEGLSFYTETILWAFNSRSSRLPRKATRHLDREIIGKSSVPAVIFERSGRKISC